MRSLMLSLLSMAMVGTIALAQDKKKEDAPKEATFVSLRKEFLDKYRGAKSADERNEALKEFGPKFLELAEKGGKDSFGSLMFAIQVANNGKDSELTKKSLDLLKKSHLDNPELADALPMLLRSLGKNGDEFCKMLMEKGGTNEVKAGACFALLEAKEDALATAKGEEANKLKAEMAELRKLGVEKFKMKDIFVGATLPDLKSQDLDGKPVKLSDHKGKVVVLDIWATWCGPCRAMIPHERELVERLKDKPFSLISISFDDKKETVTKFLEKEKMPWTHWYNGRAGSLDEELNIRYFPTIFVLDGKGVIRFKGVRGPAMDKAVDSLLKEIELEQSSR